MSTPIRAWWLLLVLLAFLSFSPRATAFPAGADHFEDASAIPFIVGVSDSTTLTNYTADNSEPHHGFSSSGPFHSAWWQWSTSLAGLCTVDTLLSAQLSDCVGDTQLSIYRWVNGQLQLAARSEDTGDTFLSSATFYAVPGALYYIAVDCPSASTGSIILRLREWTPENANWNGILQPTLFNDTPSGGITLHTTRLGTLTGKLVIDGKTLPFKGTWGGDGRFKTSFSFPTAGQLVTRPLDLTIDGAETKGGLLVELSDGVERYTGEIGRVLSFSRLNPAADSGTYNVSLNESGGSTTFTGFGSIRLTISPSGTAKAVGFLGDGQPITFAAPLITSRLDDASVAPVHLPLFKGKGYLNGYLYASRSVNPAEGGVLRMVYRRPANASSAYYASGFQIALDGGGTLYEKPAAGQRVYGMFNPDGAARFGVVTAGNEVAGFSTSAVLSIRNLFSFPQVGSLVTMKLDPATGWVTGRAIDPTNKSRTLRGLAVKFGSTALIRGFTSGTTRTAAFGVLAE